MNDQISFNRLNGGQNVPRPPFGDAALIYDFDGSLKIVDGDTGSKTPLLTSLNNQDLEITDATKGIILKSANNNRYRLTIDNDGIPTTTAL